MAVLIELGFTRFNLLVFVFISKNHYIFFLTDSAEKDFVGATLVQVLHKLLTDEKSAPEIKYNSMILICSVMGSGEES